MCVNNSKYFIIVSFNIKIDVIQGWPYLANKFTIRSISGFKKWK